MFSQVFVCSCNLARYSVFGRISVGVKIKVHNVFLHSHIHLFQINIKY